MRPELSELQTLNAAVQADKGAAKSVKAWINEATAQLAPPVTLLADTRAAHMSAISSQIVAVAGAVDTVVDHNGVPLGVGWTTAQSQTPAGFWDDLLFTGNDVTIQADPRYGSVYRFRITGDSHNPYWNTPTVGNTTVVKSRPVSLGQFDWYGLAVLWEPGWDFTKIDWSVVLQCAYPTISTPPLGIFAGYGDNIYVQRWAGPVVTGPAQANIWNVRKQSAISGHWLEIVLGVKWGSANDGEIHYLDRCKDLGETAFAERVTAMAVTTWQWGGTAPKNPVDFPVVDKLDCYRGYIAPGTDDAAPTNYLRHTGYVRAADKASVLSVMNAQ